MQSDLYASSRAARSAEPLSETMQQGVEELGRLSGKAREVVDRVRDRTSALSDRVASDGGRLYEDARSWVVAHPMQAVGAALAAGVLIALLTRSRHGYDD